MEPAADPRHGTHAGYYCIPCRQRCCRDAVALYERRRTKLRKLGQMRTYPVAGTHRRLQALATLGWTQEHIAVAGGWPSTIAVRQLYRNRIVTVATLRRVMTAYAKLSDRQGPSNLARLNAARRGWLPPLAWDDDTIDDPQTLPWAGEAVTVDEVAVQRVLAGEWRLSLTRDERLLVLDQWRACGRSINDLERLTGWNVHRDARSAAA